MALIDLHFHSQALDMQVAMYIIVPEPASLSRPHELPVLYLLHGLSDDHSIWLRRTSIERYALERQIAVVMPNVHRSFYTNMVRGLRYWDFVSEEVPRVATTLFPFAIEREKSYVAGLSMGGYGAFKLALRHPARFCAAASLSGALDTIHQWTEPPSQREWSDVFGPLGALPGSEHDLLKLMEDVSKQNGPLPRLYQWCGTEDFLYDHNQRFLQRGRALGLDLTYEEGPGGHEWSCWDRMIVRVLDWMELRRTAC